ncbi:MAG: PD-(D/E)XK nuclease family protein [Gloeomargarita sp. SKYBB_i_bin120]|nr:PD-(D/E)XK nuclease family protein [Gloeomargarita sp. SKYB120]MDW8178860.1 PD-(D/E)XK nuclease family protein [Gloeomargarita sp. SKYBB_i_bin120]
MQPKQIVINNLPPRQRPYAHPNWLAAYLAREAQCLLALHTYGRRQLPPNGSVFDTTQHDRAVAWVAANLQAQGYRVFTQENNKFWLTTQNGLTISGQPDIVALASSTSESLVVEVKTGSALPKHQAQLEIYMAAAPCVGLHQLTTIPRGRLVYVDPQKMAIINSIEIPPERINDSWKQNMRRLTAVITAKEPPAPSPSMAECQFCRLNAVCPAAAQPATGTADF